MRFTHTICSCSPLRRREPERKYEKMCLEAMLEGLKGPLPFPMFLYMYLLELVCFFSAFHLSLFASPFSFPSSSLPSLLFLILSLRLSLFLFWLVAPFLSFSSYYYMPPWNDGKLLGGKRDFYLSSTIFQKGREGFRGGKIVYSFLLSLLFIFVLPLPFELFVYPLTCVAVLVDISPFF